MSAPLTLAAALVRLRQYGERTSTWSTATYNDGTEKALHEIALTLAAEVDRLSDDVTGAYLARYEEELDADRLRLALASAQRGRRELRARVAELEALTPAPIQTCPSCGAGYDYGKPCSVCEFQARMAADSEILRAAPDNSDAWSDEEWAAWGRIADRAHSTRPKPHPASETERWNAQYPVGTPVTAYPGCRPEDDPKCTRLVTRTRSAASVLGGHTAVVWVDGHSSCISLTHVDPAPGAAS